MGLDNHLCPCDGKIVRLRMYNFVVREIFHGKFVMLPVHDYDMPSPVFLV